MQPPPGGFFYFTQRREVREERKEEKINRQDARKEGLQASSRKLQAKEVLLPYAFYPLPLLRLRELRVFA